MKRFDTRKMVGKPLIKIKPKWSPATWSVALLPIHGVIFKVEDDELIRWSDMTAWFVWEPTACPTPYRAPAGWGLVPEDPFDDLVAVLKGHPAYLLKDDEVDWTGLIDLLELDADTESPVREFLTRLRKKKRRERLAWARRTYDQLS